MGKEDLLTVLKEGRKERRKGWREKGRKGGRKGGRGGENIKVTWLCSTTLGNFFPGTWRAPEPRFPIRRF